MERNQPLPEWAASRPEIAPGDDFYLRAFWELNTTRSFGMTVGPIPWNHAVNYGERNGLDEGMMSAFVRIIRRLDDAYLTWVREDQQAKTKASKRDAEREAKKAKRRGPKSRG